jgi:N-acetylmuramic acid 6-phosphate (MurNAc-6-P) etherase
MTDPQLKALIRVKQMLLNAWAEIYMVSNGDYKGSLIDLRKDIQQLEERINRLLEGNEE